MLAVLLAEEGPNRGPDYGKASPIGLLIVALLLIGLFLLLRSMNRHLKKVPPNFDTPAESEAATAAGAESGDDDGAPDPAPEPPVATAGDSPPAGIPPVPPRESGG